VSRDLSDLMRLALSAGSSDLSSNDLPIGAVIVDSLGSVVCCARNAVIESGESTAHAELLAIRALGSVSRDRREAGMTMIVTLEPCPMCAWAIRLAGIGRVIFGAYNPQYGAAGSIFDLLRDTRYGRGVEVIGGVLSEDCQRILGDAFSKLRNNRSR